MDANNPTATHGSRLPEGLRSAAKTRVNIDASTAARNDASVIPVLAMVQEVGSIRYEANARKLAFGDIPTRRQSSKINQPVAAAPMDDRAISATDGSNPSIEAAAAKAAAPGGQATWGTGSPPLMIEQGKALSMLRSHCRQEDSKPR
jgi:hypothetical protein